MRRKGSGTSGVVGLGSVPLKRGRVHRSNSIGMETRFADNDNTQSRKTQSIKSMSMEILEEDED